MKPNYTTIAIAAFVSALLYVAGVTGLLTGILMLMVPGVPLLWVGFRYGAQATTIVVGISSVLVLGLAGVDAGVMFLSYVSMPVWLFVRQLLRIRVHGDVMTVEWSSVGSATLVVLLYAGVGVMSAALMANLSDTSLTTLIQQDLQGLSKALDPKFASTVDLISQRYPFMLIAFMVWIWALLLYGATVLAHFICATGKPPVVLRPSVALTMFLPSNFWLGLLLIGGLSFFIEEPDIQLVGASWFLIALYPYILVTVAMVHQRLKPKENRRFWLGGFYLFIFLGQMPVLMVMAMFGLYQHLQRLGSSVQS